MLPSSHCSSQMQSSQEFKSSPSFASLFIHWVCFFAVVCFFCIFHYSVFSAKIKTVQSTQAHKYAHKDVVWEISSVSVVLSKEDQRSEVFWASHWNLSLHYSKRVFFLCLYCLKCQTLTIFDLYLCRVFSLERCFYILLMKEETCTFLKSYIQMAFDKLDLIRHKFKSQLKAKKPKTSSAEQTWQNREWQFALAELQANKPVG